MGEPHPAGEVVPDRSQQRIQQAAGLGQPAAPARSRVRAGLDALRPYLSLGSAIESLWLDAAHRGDRTWAKHQDINDVMLATSLVPQGYLGLLPAA